MTQWIDPAGIETSGEGLTLAHFEDGKVIEVWENADLGVVLQQLSVVKRSSG